MNYVGRTHTIVRLQTRIRRKDGTEIFGRFVFVLDGFVQRDFVSWVFLCSFNFSVSFPATTPRATTPHRYPTGYHALSTTARLSRLYIYIYIPAIRHSLVLLLGYHTRAITLHHTRKSGCHTRHSSYEVVRSLPFTGYHAACFSPSTPPGRHTYQPTRYSTSTTV